MASSSGSSESTSLLETSTGHHEPMDQQSAANAEDLTADSAIGLIMEDLPNIADNQSQENVNNELLQPTSHLSILSSNQPSSLNEASPPPSRTASSSKSPRKTRNSRPPEEPEETSSSRQTLETRASDTGLQEQLDLIPAIDSQEPSSVEAGLTISPNPGMSSDHESVVTIPNNAQGKDRSRSRPKKRSHSNGRSRQHRTKTLRVKRRRVSREKSLRSSQPKDRRQGTSRKPAKNSRKILQKKNPKARKGSLVKKMKLQVRRVIPKTTTRVVRQVRKQGNSKHRSLP